MAAVADWSTTKQQQQLCNQVHVQQMRFHVDILGRAMRPEPEIRRYISPDADDAAAAESRRALRDEGVADVPRHARVGAARQHPGTCALPDHQISPFCHGLTLI